MSGRMAHEDSISRIGSSARFCGPRRVAPTGTPPRVPSEPVPSPRQWNPGRVQAATGRAPEACPPRSRRRASQGFPALHRRRRAASAPRGVPLRDCPRYGSAIRAPLGQRCREDHAQSQRSSAAPSQGTGGARRDHAHQICRERLARTPLRRTREKAGLPFATRDGDRNFTAQRRHLRPRSAL